MDHRWRGPDAGLIWCWDLGGKEPTKSPNWPKELEKGLWCHSVGKVASPTAQKAKQRRDLFFIWQSGKVLLAKISTLTPKVILVWFV